MTTKIQRIESDPTNDTLDRQLEARIADPLWMLCRQWQLGEFQGEDAASPAWVEASVAVGKLDTAAVGAGPAKSLDLNRTAEASVLGEPRCWTPRLRAEVGRHFARLDKTWSGWRATDQGQALVLKPPSPEALSSATPAERGFWRVVGGRVPDGEKLLGLDLTTAPKGMTAAQLTSARAALKTLKEQVPVLYGTIGAAPAAPDSWRRDQLEHRATFTGSATPASGATKEQVQFAATADVGGGLDWYSFDVSGSPPSAARLKKTQTIKTIPSAVSFTGAPDQRFWAFEDSAASLSTLTADTSQLARLLFLDFLLVHGVDWFMLPLRLELGSLCWVSGLEVVDVFGGRVPVPRAEDMDAPAVEKGRGRFSMFTHAIDPEKKRDGTAGRIADFLLVPPVSPPAVQTGPVLEQVRFLRDEDANLVWAIESTVPDGLGRPVSGHGQAMDRLRSPSSLERDPGLLYYELRTPVPDNWIPFAPHTLNTFTGEMALRRAALLGLDGERIPTPQGLVLNTPDGQPYTLREEEVPRGGVWVSRVPCRSRGADGSTTVWLRWQSEFGAGEGRSGLRYDVATPGNASDSMKQIGE